MFGRNYDNEIADLKEKAASLQKQVWELKSDQVLLLKHLNLTRISTPASNELVPPDDPRAVAAHERMQGLVRAQMQSDGSAAFMPYGFYRGMA